MTSFDHVTLAQRVRFGTGGATQALTDEVTESGAQRVMVLASNRDAAVVDAVVGGIDVALRWDEIIAHVPIELADKATAAASAAGADLLVCVGGGSTIGLAKAIAKNTHIPIVAVPTTYAGSEATNVWGLTQSARKTTGIDNAVLPRTVVYDADLTLSMPVDLSIASGLNAVAHCVDSLWAPRADPITRMTATEGLRLLAEGLPAIKEDPNGIDGRESALAGTYLSAVAFADAGSALHHKICHALGGTYNMPHAQTHAVVLPHVLAFNAPAATEAAARIAGALNVDDAVAGLNALRGRLDAPKSLRDYGFRESDIPEAARIILPAVPASNPRPVTQADLEQILHDAFVGTNHTATKDFAQ